MTGARHRNTPWLSRFAFAYIAQKILTVSQEILNIMTQAM
jgi:hypothetical protein